VDGLVLASRIDDLGAATAVADGDAHGIVLTGAAGIGKTRVARDAMRLLVGRDVPVAWVQGTEMARRIPFGAVAPYLPAIDTTADVLPILITATRALRELGGGRTVVVIVDDAPLLDDASALLLSQSVTAGDVRVVVTQRSGESLPDALARLGLPRRELAALDPPSVVELAEALAGGPLAGRTRERLVRLSGGNPLYLHEVVLAGNEANAWRPGPDGLVLDDAVGAAPRLTELVGARFDGLAQDAEEAVALLAVGEPLGLSTVEALTSPGAVEHLDEAGLVDVVVDGRRTQLRLAHPIYAEVLRERMSVLRRRRLARRLADQVRAQGGRRRDDLMRSATWYLDAGGDVPADLLADAARHARLAGDVVLAERLLRASMAAAPSFAAGHLLADTLYRQGHTHEVHRVLDAVESLALTDAERATCTMTRAADCYWNVGDLRAAEDGIARVAAGSDPQVVLAATALRASLLACSRRFREAEVLARACLDAPPSRAALDAALAIGFSTRAMGRGEQALTVIDDTLALYSSLGEDAAVMTMQVMGSARISTLVDLGRLDEADATAEATLVAARTTGEEAALGFVELGRGLSAIARGRFRTAMHHYASAEAHLQALNRPGMLRWALIGGFEAAVAAGDVGAAVAQRDRLVALGSHPATLFDGTLARAHAALLRAGGQLERARERWEEAAADAAAVDDHVTEAECLHDLVRLGRPELAVERLTALAAELDGAWIAIFSRHAAAAATSDAAALCEVADQFAHLGAMALASEVALEAADAWARAGEQRTSARWRRRATELAVGVERDGDPTAAGLGGADPLTRREREIAELAAAGHTSKEIAARLFLSARTVESHLLRVYAKLGVRTRAELSSVLAGSPAASR
jgi:DNA-binding CsgD family transcriptional regulator/tetratricopeptide (TPR) repeat protein